MFRVIKDSIVHTVDNAKQISDFTNCGLEYVTAVTSLQVSAKLGPWTIEPDNDEHQDETLSGLYSQVLEYAPRVLKHSLMSEKDKIEQLCLSLNLVEQGYYALHRNVEVTGEEPFIARFNYELIRLNTKYFEGQMQVSDAIVGEAVFQGSYGAGLCFIMGKRLELEKQEK